MKSVITSFFVALTPDTGDPIGSPIVVPVDGSDATTEFDLGDGVTYILEATGEMDSHDTDPGVNMGDAYYTDFPSGDVDHWLHTAGISSFDVEPDDDLPDWGPWNSSHTYFTSFVGDGGEMTLSYSDDYSTTDNSNAGENPLSVQIYGMSDTTPTVSLTAYRTGGNFGQPVSSGVKTGGNPADYVVLVNDNFDQNSDMSAEDDALPTAPIKNDAMELNDDDSPKDPDFGRLNLSLSTTAHLGGTVALTLSDPSAVKLFDGNGNPLTDLTLYYPDTTGGLQQLASGSMDVWFEGVAADSDFVFTLTYTDNTGAVDSTDTIHMDIVDFTFVDTGGNQVFQAAPLWKDALVAAVSGAEEPLQDPTGSGGPGTDASSDFFRAQLAGLASGVGQSLQVMSEDDPTDTYTETLDYSGSSTTATATNYTVFYNGDIYLSTDDTPLTSRQRSSILDNLGLDAVHNPGEITVWNPDPYDSQERELKVDYFTKLIIGNDVVTAGGEITGQVVVNTSDKTWIEVETSDGQTAIGTGNQLNFTFNAPTTAQFFTIDAIAVPFSVYGGPPNPQSPWLPLNNSALIDVLATGQTMSNWQKAAWKDLHVGGIVSANPMTRNRRITELYSDLFNAGSIGPLLNPFQWYGMAAFASQHVGEAMTMAYLYNFYFSNPANPVGLVLPDPQKAYNYLGIGNLAVYMDMYPQGLAYLTSGIKAIKDMQTAGQLLAGQQAAWITINNGMILSSAVFILFGAQAQLNIEQSITLQLAVYNLDLPFWKSMTTNWIIMYGMPLMTGLPGDTSNFVDWCKANPAIVGTNYDFGTAYDRYQWILNNGYVTYSRWSVRGATINVSRLLSGGY